MKIRNIIENSQHILVVSPHLDDGLLSCALLVQYAASLGIKVTVATIFSRGDDYEQRKKEDYRACEEIGACPLHFDFLDAPYRGSGYFDIESLVFGECRSAEHSIANQVHSRLLEVIEQTSPALVIAPLAVGYHIDHRIVHEACRRIGNQRLWWYEDRPYCLWDGSVQARFSQLKLAWRGADISSCEYHQPPYYLNAFVPCGSIRDTLFPLYEQRVLASRLKSPTGECSFKADSLSTANHNERDLIWNTLSYYSSQIELIYGNYEQFCIDTQPIGGVHGLYAERYWYECDQELPPTVPA